MPALTPFTESVVEDAALAWLEAAGWTIAKGPGIAPDRPEAERRNFEEDFSACRFRDTLLPKLSSDELRVNDAETLIWRTIKNE